MDAVCGAPFRAADAWEQTRDEFVTRDVQVIASAGFPASKTFGIRLSQPHHKNIVSCPTIHSIAKDCWAER